MYTVLRIRLNRNHNALVLLSNLQLGAAHFNSLLFYSSQLTSHQFTLPHIISSHLISTDRNPDFYLLILVGKKSGGGPQPLASTATQTPYLFGDCARTSVGKHALGYWRRRCFAESEGVRLGVESAVAVAVGGGGGREREPPKMTELHLTAIDRMLGELAIIHGLVADADSGGSGSRNRSGGGSSDCAKSSVAESRDLFSLLSLTDDTGSRAGSRAGRATANVTLNSAFRDGCGLGIGGQGVHADGQNSSNSGDGGGDANPLRPISKTLKATKESANALHARRKLRRHDPLSWEDIQAAYFYQLAIKYLLRYAPSGAFAVRGGRSVMAELTFLRIFEFDIYLVHLNLLLLS